MNRCWQEERIYQVALYRMLPVYFPFGVEIEDILDIITFIVKTDTKFLFLRVHVVQYSVIHIWEKLVLTFTLLFILEKISMNNQKSWNIIICGWVFKVHALTYILKTITPSHGTYSLSFTICTAGIKCRMCLLSELK